LKKRSSYADGAQVYTIVDLLGKCHERYLQDVPNLSILQIHFQSAFVLNPVRHVLGYLRVRYTRSVYGCFSAELFSNWKGKLGIVYRRSTIFSIHMMVPNLLPFQMSTPKKCLFASIKARFMCSLF